MPKPCAGFPSCSWILGCPGGSRRPGDRSDDPAAPRPAPDRGTGEPAPAGSTRPSRSCRRRGGTRPAADSAAASTRSSSLEAHVAVAGHVDVGNVPEIVVPEGDDTLLPGHPGARCASGSPRAGWAGWTGWRTSPRRRRSAAGRSVISAPACAVAAGPWAAAESGERPDPSGARRRHGSSGQLHDQSVGVVAGQPERLGESPGHLAPGQTLGQERGGSLHRLVGAIGCRRRASRFLPARR